MFRKIMIGLGAVVVTAYLAGFILPDEVKVKRDILIDAPRERVFALVSDFNAWDQWSPWKQMDPEAIFAITGTGEGQKMMWESDNPAVGRGSQMVTTYEPPRTVETRLDLGQWGNGYGAFILLEEKGGTRITWEYNGKMREGLPLWQKPIHTYYGLFMDEMLGPTYERGLAQLKEAAEQPV